MAEVITDKQIVTVLRPFVRATTPLLSALRESDPLGLVRRVLPKATDGPGTEVLAPGDAEDAEALATVDRSRREKLLAGLESLKVPGTHAWSEMTVADRDDWWVNRVGRFTVLLASIPGLGGALADRLPIQDALATAGQGLLLSALAAEHGVTEQADRVRLIAAVLFERDIDPRLAAGEGDHLSDEEEDAATAEISRSQVWQWVRNEVVLDTGDTVTPDLVRSVLAEVVADLADLPRLALAAELFADVALAEDYPDFLTVPAYERI